jgi:hypothetical protein
MHLSQQHRPHPQGAWLKNRISNGNGGFLWHNHITDTQKGGKQETIQHSGYKNNNIM